EAGDGPTAAPGAVSLERRTRVGMLMRTGVAADLGEHRTTIAAVRGLVREEHRVDDLQVQRPSAERVRAEGATTEVEGLVPLEPAVDDRGGGEAERSVGRERERATGIPLVLGEPHLPQAEERSAAAGGGHGDRATGPEQIPRVGRGDRLRDD